MKMNNDTKKAKEKLAEGYTCVMVKGGEERCFTERGVAPLLSLLPHKGGCFADKVVGKAAAYLYVLLEAGEVYAKTISEGAKSVLERYKIPFEYGEAVPAVINRKGDGLCPLERALSGEYTPREALAVIKETLEKLKES